MTTCLLDINVLIALLDPAHVNHETAHRWFETIADHQWATCPITENGVIRILSNPGYPTIDWMPGEVIAHLGDFFIPELGHVFWPDAVSLQDDQLFDHRMFSGHKQLTDIYLLGLAVSQKGRLITFDRSIPRRAVKGANDSDLSILS